MYDIGTVRGRAFSIGDVCDDHVTLLHITSNPQSESGTVNKCRVCIFSRRLWRGRKISYFHTEQTLVNFSKYTANRSIPDVRPR